jgi:Alginate O-acetyl transferase AlgF
VNVLKSPTLKMTGLVCGLFWAGHVFAQDAGLYEDVIDPNAAFVRVIAPKAMQMVVQTTSFPGVNTGVSPYVEISQPGEVRISAGVAEATVDVTAGTFTTYLIAADGSGTVLQDKISGSPAQADVAFYNLSDKTDVDLYVPAAKAVAIAAIGPNGSGSVALKAPLTLDFEARIGEDVIGKVVGISLARREGVTLVLRGTGGTYELVSAANTVAR